MTDKTASRVAHICDVLRNETIEPAKQEAKEILENAALQSKEIISQAKKEAEKIAISEQAERNRKKRMFDSSLEIAFRQFIDALKEQIEEKLFHENLQELLTKATNKSEVLAKIINALVKAVQEEGLDGDMRAYVAKSVSPKEINDLLLSEVLDKLAGKSVILGEFEGGVKLQLINKQMTIDVSDKVLQEVIASYIQEDFRKLIFTV
jgi:V/A-type H+/Na+-transporting ATPase subunit E